MHLVRVSFGLCCGIRVRLTSTEKKKIKTSLKMSYFFQETLTMAVTAVHYIAPDMCNMFVFINKGNNLLASVS